MDEYSLERSHLHIKGKILNMYTCVKLVMIAFFKDGDKFWKIPECYIRGISIKYLRIPDEVHICIFAKCYSHSSFFVTDQHSC